MIYPTLYRVTVVFKDRTQIIKEGSNVSVMWSDGLAGYSTSGYDTYLWNRDLVESLSREVVAWATPKDK